MIAPLLFQSLIVYCGQMVMNLRLAWLCILLSAREADLMTAKPIVRNQAGFDSKVMISFVQLRSRLEGDPNREHQCGR